MNQESQPIKSNPACRKTSLLLKTDQVCYMFFTLSEKKQFTNLQIATVEKFFSMVHVIVTTCSNSCFHSMIG